MPRFYEISDTFTKCGLASVSITNSFLIFLTVFHIKRIVGTYKQMVIIFATIGIIFSAWELVARPFVHNYNGGFIYFSLNTWIGGSQEFLQIALVIYAGFYLFMLSFIAVQFLFRYLTLVNSKFAKKFGGKGIIVWMSYAIISGLIYGSLILVFGHPDDYSDSYMSDKILETYSLAVKELPRMLLIPYAADGSLRWRNVLFLFVGGLDIIIQYAMIIYCGVQMHLVMKKEFTTSSVPNKKLQEQFFRALIVQTIVPTILFVFPAGLVIFTPFLDIKVNFQTGWIYAALSLYPPIDSIVFMLLISEYRKVTKELYKLIFPDKPRRSSEGTSTVVRI